MVSHSVGREVKIAGETRHGTRAYLCAGKHVGREVEFLQAVSLLSKVSPLVLVKVELDPGARVKEPRYACNRQMRVASTQQGELVLIKHSLR
jgi:hypothetical protein